MAAYFIADLEVVNLEPFKEYQAGTPPTIEAHGGRYIVRGGTANTVEGDWNPKRVVVVEFPDRETAERWYNSPEYQAILPLRLENTKGSAILVDGV